MVNYGVQRSEFGNLCYIAVRGLSYNSCIGMDIVTVLPAIISFEHRIAQSQILSTISLSLYFYYEGFSVFSFFTNQFFFDT
jgi:hypothetical protein